jgi:signal peptidase I
MSALTGLLYGVLVIYLGGWYIGKWSGNFSLLLFCLTLFTFAYWLAERFIFAPRRVQAAALIDQQAQARRDSLSQQGITKVDEGNLVQAKQALMAQPWWLDWTAGLFPVILAVFLLRSFLFEPFKIPTGSMIPTLLVGDLILVNKFHYGIRLPVINKKILSNHDPKRGDVMVFRYPLDTNVDYIKRVVGVPGDEIRYSNQRLYLNGQQLATTALPDFYDDDSRRYAKQYNEKLGEVDHRILVDLERPSFVPANSSFPFAENCRYSAEGVTCTVPPGHYFMMGDNRDNSQDSRYWGFVPDENIVGRAFFVWMHINGWDIKLDRIGIFR